MENREVTSPSVEAAQAQRKLPFTKALNIQTVTRPTNRSKKKPKAINFNLDETVPIAGDVKRILTNCPNAEFYFLFHNDQRLQPSRHQERQGLLMGSGADCRRSAGWRVGENLARTGGLF